LAKQEDPKQGRKLVRRHSDTSAITADKVRKEAAKVKKEAGKSKDLDVIERTSTNTSAAPTRRKRAQSIGGAHPLARDIQTSQLHSDIQSIMDDAASLLEIPSFKPMKVTRIGVTLCKPEVKLLLMLTIDKIVSIRKTKPMEDAFKRWKLNARLVSASEELKLERRRREMDAQESRNVLEYAQEMEEKSRQANAALAALKQQMQEMETTKRVEQQAQAASHSKELEEVSTCSALAVARARQVHEQAMVIMRQEVDEEIDVLRDQHQRQLEQIKQSALVAKGLMIKEAMRQLGQTYRHALMKEVMWCWQGGHPAKWRMRLTVEVIEAQGLPFRSKYASLSHKGPNFLTNLWLEPSERLLETSHFKTKVQFKTSTPKWRQKFVFMPIATETGQIRISIADFDSSAGVEHVVAEGLVDFAHLLKQGEGKREEGGGRGGAAAEEGWYKLFKPATLAKPCGHRPPKDEELKPPPTSPRGRGGRGGRGLGGGRGRCGRGGRGSGKQEVGVGGVRYKQLAGGWVTPVDVHDEVGHDAHRSNRKRRETISQLSVINSALNTNQAHLLGGGEEEEGDADLDESGKSSTGEGKGLRRLSTVLGRTDSHGRMVSIVSKTPPSPSDRKSVMNSRTIDENEDEDATESDEDSKEGGPEEGAEGEGVEADTKTEAGSRKSPQKSARSITLRKQIVGDRVEEGRPLFVQEMRESWARGRTDWTAEELELKDGADDADGNRVKVTAYDNHHAVLAKRGTGKPCVGLQLVPKSATGATANRDGGSRVVLKGGGAVGHSVQSKPARTRDRMGSFYAASSDQAAELRMNRNYNERIQNRQAGGSGAVGSIQDHGEVSNVPTALQIQNYSEPIPAGKLKLRCVRENL
jgi:hypothetical protein